MIKVDLSTPPGTLLRRTKNSILGWFYMMDKGDVCILLEVCPRQNHEGLSLNVLSKQGEVIKGASARYFEVIE